jgi:hypothetical protein
MCADETIRTEIWVSFSLVKLLKEACFYSKRVQGVKQSVIFLTTDDSKTVDLKVDSWSPFVIRSYARDPRDPQSAALPPNWCLFVFHSWLVFYGWIWSVQRNCQTANALIPTDTAKREISGTELFAEPLPVSKRNIHGSKIMA